MAGMLRGGHAAFVGMAEVGHEEGAVTRRGHLGRGCCHRPPPLPQLCKTCNNQTDAIQWSRWPWHAPRAFSSAQFVLLPVPLAGDPSVHGAGEAETRSMPWQAE